VNVLNKPRGVVLLFQVRACKNLTSFRMSHRTSNSDRFLDSGQNQLVVVFEPLGFVKYREFLDHLNNYKFLKKTVQSLCHLVNISIHCPRKNTDWSSTAYTGLALQKYKHTLIHPLTPFLGGRKIAKCDC